MTALQMIAAWRRGCPCWPPGKPEECHRCTLALIDALERTLTADAGPPPATDGLPESMRLEVRSVEEPVDAPDAGPWRLVIECEPSRSGTYEVRFAAGEDEPVVELQFVAAPGAGFWHSGEPPPNDFAVLPALAQWRPIPGQRARQLRDRTEQRSTWP